MKFGTKIGMKTGLLIAMPLAVSLCGASRAEDALTPEQVTLYTQCQKSPPDERIKPCSDAIESGLFSGLELAGLHLDRALGFEAAGDGNSALLDYNRAVVLAPTNPGMYFNRGVFFAAGGNYDAALRDYAAALRLDPGYVAALYNRGRVLEYRGDTAAALADFSAGIRLSPAAASLYVQRGLVYFRLQDYARAIQEEDIAIRLDPIEGLAYLFRAKAHQADGKTDLVAGDVATAIQLNPELARLVHWTGKVPLISPPPP
jgi:tetratricopeptide (TPR) repeat protein